MIHTTDNISPQHKHWPAGPADFSDHRTSSGQCILSFTGPYGPVKDMSDHQISNSAGPNDDKSQFVLFARRPPHISAVFAQSFCYSETPAWCESESDDLLIKRTSTLTSVFRSRRHETSMRTSETHLGTFLREAHDDAPSKQFRFVLLFSWMRGDFCSVNLKYWLINLLHWVT